MDKDLLEFLQAFREEVTTRLDEMDRRFNGLNGRFDAMEMRVNEMEKRLNGRIDALREETTQRLGTLEATLRDEIRGAYILIEDLRDQIKLVAEGVAGVEEKLQAHREEMAKKLDNLESFTRRTYRELDARIRRLEAT